MRAALLSAILATAGFTAPAAADCIGAFCSGDPAVAELTGIAAVTDGDTITIGPMPVRLHGIDAPEAGQTCATPGGGSWPCGEKATAKLAKLAHAKLVRCLGRERDSYDRLVAVCAVDGQELNAAMIRDGLAWAFVRYSDDYVTLESEARATVQKHIVSSRLQH